jgi:putative ABC transport system substrate-binding protein
MMEIAPTLGLTNIPVEARGLDALEPAFAIMMRERAQAFVMQEMLCCTTIAPRLRKWL